MKRRKAAAAQAQPKLGWRDANKYWTKDPLWVAYRLYENAMGPHVPSDTRVTVHLELMPICNGLFPAGDLLMLDWAKMVGNGE